MRTAALEPELPIIDTHHHLWDRGGWTYLLPELLADLDTGHNRMSPFLGAVVADEIVGGRQRAELAHFRPARFFN